MYVQNYDRNMAKSRGGRPIKLVLSWLINRELTDTEMAEALGVKKSYYSRHKDDENFPDFHDIEKLASHFGVDPIPLQISFGYRDAEEVILLDHEGLRQYLEIGSEGEVS